MTRNIPQFRWFYSMEWIGIKCNSRIGYQSTPRQKSHEIGWKLNARWLTNITFRFCVPTFYFNQRWRVGYVMQRLHRYLFTIARTNRRRLNRLHLNATRRWCRWHLIIGAWSRFIANGIGMLLIRFSSLTIRISATTATLGGLAMVLLWLWLMWLLLPQLVLVVLVVVIVAWCRRWFSWICFTWLSYCFR